MKPDDPELSGDGGRGLGGGHAGAVAQPEDVGEPDEQVGRDEMLQHQLVVLQRLLVDVEEAGGIGEAGVGGERLRGAHRGSHVQQVVGHRHLDGGFNNRLVWELFHRLLCVKVLENGLLGLWLDLNQVVPQVHIDSPNMRSQNVLEVSKCA